MAKSYYSVVLDHSAQAVWAVIRPFDHYAWAGVTGETVIEDGRGSTEVSAIRRVDLGGGKVIRQVLLAHSDRDRSYTYAFDNAIPYPVTDYVATIRVTPVVETEQAFVEWQACFDCAADDLAHWTRYFERDGFAVWLAALRRFMAEHTS